MKRKVAVFTGNRAEYGLQLPILRALAARPDIESGLIVSGAHLDKDFGKTLSEIQANGFRIFDEAAIEMGDDTLFGTSMGISSCIRSVTEILRRLKPDFLVVYADRFEGFGAVVAGTQMRIPTAHIEGGDLTEGGALDDSIRHAMTKLAHLHFTTNEEAAARVRQLGEEPWRVFNVGFPAVDLIVGGELATPAELRDRYGIDPAKPVVVFTQHSVSLQFDQAVDQLKPSLEAMEVLAREGVQVVLTYPNNDAGGRSIAEELERFHAGKFPGVQLHKSLGRYNYHGMLKLCGREGTGVCVGNSSSGIKETPVLGCPTVNIGSRQKGRLAADNVIHVGYDREEILKAVRKGLFDGAFRRQCATCVNPYGAGGSGKLIAETLATVPIDERLLIKKMVTL
jgi:UDP-N-acetylglucosamine 2-epimerase (non-hydrolysing)/GDP/UDP-N,N'-diacetylbacillosamine 2-epimerase (hydrolysing)